MKAIETLKGYHTYNSLVENLPKIHDDLLNYFEGIPVSTVRYILREFEKNVLDSNSIVVKKS